jgi:hypothetical protein
LRSALDLELATIKDDSDEDDDLEEDALADKEKQLSKAVEDFEDKVTLSSRIIIYHAPFSNADS